MVEYTDLSVSDIYEYDINNNGVEDIRICTICLEDITKKDENTYH